MFNDGVEERELDLNAFIRGEELYLAHKSKIRELTCGFSKQYIKNRGKSRAGLKNTIKRRSKGHTS